ncbi:MAG: 50S ribosomal protein L17 [Leeuwenhoekiella sp.]
MRHRKKFNHLGRKTAHRKSMLANMACSLIEHKRINTTIAKAKALRVFVEPLVTKSKVDTTHNRRLVMSKLRQKDAVSELFREVAVKVGDRPGGYTRIIKLGSRLGDNADMAMIELVDYNEIYNTAKSAKKKSTRRAGKKTSSSEQEETTEVSDSVQEDSKSEKDSKKENKSDEVKDQNSDESKENDSKE